MFSNKNSTTRCFLKNKIKFRRVKCRSLGKNMFSREFSEILDEIRQICDLLLNSNNSPAFLSNSDRFRRKNVCYLKEFNRNCFRKPVYQFQTS